MTTYLAALQNLTGMGGSGTGTQTPIRKSIELARLDHIMRSQATHLCTRILEDLENGVYECPICSDSIVHSGTPLWSCSSCYQVYHHSCTQEWAESRNAGIFLAQPWPCPTCKHEHISYPVEKCWCGRESYLNIPDSGNGCGKVCEKRIACRECEERNGGEWDMIGKCRTDVCTRHCHPGPCPPFPCTRKRDAEEEEEANNNPPKASKASKNQPRKPRPARMRPAESVIPSVVPRIDPNTYRTQGFDREAMAQEAEAALDAYRNQARDREAAAAFNPPNQAGPPTNFTARLTRRYQSTRHLIIDIFATFPALAFFNVIIGLWIARRIAHWIDPITHQEFVESRWRFYEIYIAIVVTVFLVPFNAFFGGLFIFRLRQLIKQGLGMTDRLGLNVTGRRDGRCKRAAKNVANVSSFVITWGGLFLGLTILMPILLLLGPGKFWATQMAETCAPFDTQVRLGGRTLSRRSTIFFRNSSDINPKSNYYGSMKIAGIDMDTLNIKTFRPPMNETVDPFTPYNTYHRIQGISSLSSSPHPIAIDYDLHNRLWRMWNFTYLPSTNGVQTQPKPANLLTTENILPRRVLNIYRENSPTVIPPSVNESSLVAVRNGSWTGTSRVEPHMLLPELGMAVQNWWFYTRHCHYQPFVRVFRLSGNNESGVGDGNEKVFGEGWSREVQRNEVMRTAKFGFGGGGKLDVCLRRGDYWAAGGKGVGKEKQMGDLMKGVGDMEGWVVLGLFATMRNEMERVGQEKGFKIKMTDSSGEKVLITSEGCDWEFV